MIQAKTKLLRRGRIAALALPLLLLGCVPGAPPPGPIDLVRMVFEPGYDYTESPDTWRDADARPRHRHEDDWSTACPRGDMTCSHEGVTVCCSPQDRCCAGRSGPFCCAGDYAGHDDGRWYDDQ